MVLWAQEVPELTDRERLSEGGFHLYSHGEVSISARARPSVVPVLWGHTCTHPISNTPPVCCTASSVDGCFTGPNSGGTKLGSVAEAPGATDVIRISPDEKFTTQQESSVGRALSGRGVQGFCSCFGLSQANGTSPCLHAV